jgi:hypothetical protein
MPTNSNIFKKYKNKYFVETGSYLGEGIQAALDCGFEKVISLEISEQYKAICDQKFYGNKNVQLVRGDSCNILYDSIKNIEDKITFWLDGHYSGGPTGLGKHEYPLIQELEQINRHHIKSHTILIDDLRIIRNEEVTATGEKVKFTESDLIDLIFKINEKYCFSYENGVGHDGKVFKRDILVAHL